MLEMKEARKQLRETGKYMMDYELAWGNAGNISARTNIDRYIITGSGTFLGELGDEDLVECSLNESYVNQTDRKASKELPMHSAIYEARPEINAVLHASPFYSTLIACSLLTIPSSWFVETMYYLERVERVAYHHPGSKALGDAVKEQAGKANILLLEHHGVLVYDTSVKEARMALHTLEMASRMLITAKNVGLELQSLNKSTVDDFLAHSGYKPRRKWES